MEPWRFTYRALGTCAAVAMLSGCGAQSGAALPRSLLTGPSAAAAPQPASKPYNGAYLYASGDASGYVLTYPSGKLVGTISGTALGTCSDAGGNVYFGEVRQVAEFAHGGTTPSATYPVPGTAAACSVDPTTGNLAVVVFCLTGCGDEVAIFPPGAGTAPIAYKDSKLTQLLFCTYDDRGNLFVDGYKSNKFAIAELPANGNALADIAFKKNIQTAYQIQWDGKYLAVQTRVDPVIYQIQVSGSTARVVNVVKFSNIGHRSTQAWIQKDKIAFPSTVNRRPESVLVFAYPAGGKPIDVVKGFIGGGHQQLDGVTFSVNPR
ncbi:MAG: hypothetical protein JO104_10215 [Candidatus Eremiobacteraeota bacterium]|nr:hypothetical protein [Candidatus Eremiobacteraeota bacterium]